MIPRSPSTSMASLISDETQSLRSGSWLSKCPSPPQHQVAFPVRVKPSNEQDFTTISSSSPFQSTPRESVCSQVFAEESCRTGTKKKASKIIPLARHASRAISMSSYSSSRTQTCGQGFATSSPTEKLASKKYTLYICSTLRFFAKLTSRCTRTIKISGLDF